MPTVTVDEDKLRALIESYFGRSHNCCADCICCEKCGTSGGGDDFCRAALLAEFGLEVRP